MGIGFRIARVDGAMIVVLLPPAAAEMIGGDLDRKAARVPESGVLQAVSYCNIHGVWQSSKDIKVEA